jgi:hypothetical protein
MDISFLCLNYSRESTCGRIKKSPRWEDDHGVAATVGTIMALMVFLAMFGLFTNQFVPIWMSDNESAHMSNALEQFTTMKSQIDGLVADFSNSYLAPTPIFIPITLHSAGIPVFAGPTAGVLYFYPQTVSGRPSFNVSYASDTYALGPLNDGHSGGYMELYCPNRYFVEQRLIYEAGAVILNQTDGEFIVAGLQFSMSSIAGEWVMKLTQTSLVGLNKTVGGTGSKGVNADLLYADTSVYKKTGGNPVTITIVTKHGNAWEGYFNRTLINSGLVYGETTGDYYITNQYYPNNNRNLAYYVLTVVIMDVGTFDYTHAVVQMSVDEIGV